MLFCSGRAVSLLSASPPISPHRCRLPDIPSSELGPCRQRSCHLVHRNILTTSFKCQRAVSCIVSSTIYLHVIRPLDDLPNRHQLRSSSSGRPEVPGSRLTTIGWRSQIHFTNFVLILIVLMAFNCNVGSQTYRQRCRSMAEYAFSISSLWVSIFQRNITLYEARLNTTSCGEVWR